MNNKKQSQKNSEIESQFVFLKPMKVSKTKNGNLLIYINNTTGISLHPNFIKAILETKKAS